MESKSVYHLNKTWRALMIVPAVSLQIISFVPLLPQINVADPFGEFVKLFTLIFPFTVMMILYSFGCRLEITKNGVKNYTSFPFHSKFTWSDIIRIEVSLLNTVNLVYNSKRTRLFPNPERGLDISMFVEDWEDNSLLQDIQEFASHLTVPDEILKRIDVAYQYRPGLLCLYLTLLLPGMLIPIAIPFQVMDKIQDVLYLASLGLLGGIFSGMNGIWEYNIMLYFLPPPDWIKKKAISIYVSPISGWIMVLVFGMIFELFSKEFNTSKLERLLPLFALGTGFIQLKILSALSRKIEA